MEKKFQKLQNYLKSLSGQGICLAFSGGIDSALLLWLLKGLNAEAAFFYSEFQDKDELDFAKKFAQDTGMACKIIEAAVLFEDNIKNNPKDRCYHCKRLIFNKIKEYTNLRNLNNIIDGTNFDDLSAYRPGLKALEEFSILSPFAMFKIGKAEIREYARILGIEIFNKPSNPCIATRFPYNTALKKEDIEKVKMGEKFLNGFGFESCRLRLHQDIVRIEISKEQFSQFLNMKDEIINTLKKTGFRYVTLDIEGLRPGSMDN